MDCQNRLVPPGPVQRLVRPQNLCVEKLVPVYSRPKEKAQWCRQANEMIEFSSILIDNQVSDLVVSPQAPSLPALGRGRVGLADPRQQKSVPNLVSAGGPNTPV